MMSSKFGVYQAKVTSNSDPEKRGRIKVKIPEVLGGEIDSAWCEPCSPVAYDGGGDICIPPINEFVWVMFIAGDVNRPVWIGGWWSKNSSPFADSYTGVDTTRIIRYADCTIVMQGGKISITGDVDIQGNVNVSGDVVAGGISLVHHVHGGVISGGGNTSTPQ